MLAGDMASPCSSCRRFCRDTRFEEWLASRQHKATRPHRRIGAADFAFGIQYWVNVDAPSQGTKHEYPPGFLRMTGAVLRAPALLRRHPPGTSFGRKPISHDPIYGRLGRSTSSRASCLSHFSSATWPAILVCENPRAAKRLARRCRAKADPDGYTILIQWRRLTLPAPAGLSRSSL